MSGCACTGPPAASAAAQASAGHGKCQLTQLLQGSSWRTRTPSPAVLFLLPCALTDFYRNSCMTTLVPCLQHCRYPLLVQNSHPQQPRMSTNLEHHSLITGRLTNMLPCEFLRRQARGALTTD